MSPNLQQNATSSDGLTPAQELALAALLAGQTITAAAQAANVNRTTLHRWLTHPDNRAFAQAYVRRRQELRLAVEARLLALATQATDCLEGVLAGGDGKAALALLKGIGFLSGPPK